AVRQFDEAKRTGLRNIFLLGAGFAVAAILLAGSVFYGGYMLGEWRAAFRISAGEKTEEGGPAMTAKSREPIKGAAVIVGLIAIAVSCVPTIGFSLLRHFFGLRGADYLDYPDGVTFCSTADKDDYWVVKWHATNFHNPEPCPFTIHLADCDLTPDDL